MTGPAGHLCLRGHEIQVVGRNERGRCRECRRIMRLRQVERYPLAPLQRQVVLLDKTLVSLYMGRYGVSRANASKVIDRVMHSEYITARMADRFACLIGVHPVMLWPEWDRDIVDIQGETE